MPWQCWFKNLCFFAPIMPKIMLAQSAKANPQVTLPFLKMNPQNNQDFENDPSTS